MHQTVKWLDDHSLGVAILDDDHKKLFDLMSEAVNAVISRDSAQLAARRFDEVLEHAQQHFVTEERLMEASAYPHKERHKEEHRQLLAQFLIAKQEYLGGNIGEIDLCIRLVEWLIDHVVQSDRELANHLRERPA